MNMPPSHTTVSGAGNDPVVVVSYPTNSLKQKLGNGGFEYQRLLKAETRMRNARQEFPFIAQRELQKINSALYYLRHPESTERPPIHWLRHIFSASVELKANSGMFHYPIIGMISDSLLYFSEHQKDADADCIQVINAHYEAFHEIFETGHDQVDEEKRDEVMQTLQETILQYRQRPAAAKN